ncbi:MAG: hypothetical protein ACK40M_01530 [Flavobacteriales bacterium]
MIKCIISVFCLFAVQAASQAVAPVGATWTYGISNITWPGGVWAEEMVVTRDTVLNGQSCSVVNGGTTFCSFWETENYLYKDVSNKVWFWDREFLQFQLLFDFGAAVGSQWKIPLHMSSTWGTDSLYVTVGNADTVLIGGNSYRRVYLVYDNHSDPLMLAGENAGWVNEMFGSDFGFFPGKHMACDDAYIYELRCYSDSQLGSIQFQSNYQCYYSTVDVSEERIHNLLVFPNPATSHIRVENYSGKLEICSVTGNIVWCGMIFGGDLSLEFLSSGLYLVRFPESNFSPKPLMIVK